MTTEKLLAKLDGVIPAGEDRWSARCPAHKDRKQSLSISRTPDRILVKCHANCETKDVVASLGLGIADLFFGERARRSEPASGVSEIVYPYCDEAGKMLFEAVRRPGKKFIQRRPDPKNPKRFIYKLGTVRRVPYRLPELVAADNGQTVFVVEGEKDVESLRARQLVATTNPGGVGSGRLWENAQFRDALRGRDVVILPDNDDPGKQHGERVARALKGCARTVRVVNLPGLPPKGDVSDWLVAGGSADELLRLATAGDAHSSSDLPEQEEQGRPPQAQLLIEIARQTCQFFTTPDDEAFAIIEKEGRRETWPVRSRTFRLMLTSAFFQRHDKSPSGQAMTEALNTVEAIAMSAGNVSSVYLRVAESDSGDKVYVDLVDGLWRAVEIDRDGWRPVEGGRCPVRFRRSKTMRALPVPVAGGSLDLLREFVNYGSEDNFRLLVAWLLFTLRVRGPFPILVLQGEQGSAKSTTARVLRRLIDPSQAPLRIPPKQDADLLIGAKNSWVLAFDNLSGMPSWLSDGLCILSTGGAYTTRAFYTNDEESVLEASRPVIVNGIDDMATRADFASRAIVVTLPRIPDGERREEDEFWQRFESQQPAILGALFSARSAVMRALPTVVLSSRPRMADFARSGVAVERGLGWPAGAFLRAYQGNQRDAEASAIEADPVASAVVTLLARQDEWTGTATELLKELDRITPDNRRGRKWPTIPNHLTSRIRRAVVALRGQGIELDEDRTCGRRALILRRATTESTVTTVTSVIPQQYRSGSDDGSGDDDGPERHRSIGPVTVNDDGGPGIVTPVSWATSDGQDGHDGHFFSSIPREKEPGRRDE